MSRDDHQSKSDHITIHTQPPTVYTALANQCLPPFLPPTSQRTTKQRALSDCGGLSFFFLPQPSFIDNRDEIQRKMTRKGHNSPARRHRWSHGTQVVMSEDRKSDKFHTLCSSSPKESGSLVKGPPSALSTQHPFQSPPSRFKIG